MLVYRIAIAAYADKLKASGRAARWNANDIEMLYTASSRSLACLENAVHRSQEGLSQLFNIMTIDCPDALPIISIESKELPEDWADYNRMYYTQQIGANWIKENKSAILKVPSSIIEEEVNYLLNPVHKDFPKIKLIKTQPFIFDSRIKTT